MKKKQLFYTLFLMLFAAVTVAQNTQESKISFALQGGINFQNLNGKDYQGDKLDNSMIIGFHGGANVMIPIVPEFFFQPGILFSTKGAEHTYGDFTSTYKLSYLELPLNLVYRASLGSGFVLLGFGPYLAYGIGGKSTFDDGNNSITNDIEFQNVVEIGDPLTVAYFKPFDAGGNIFFGYEMGNGIYAQFNAQLGMLKINPEDKRIPDDQTSIKNTGFGISLGYRF
jgi:hypothetical protein